MDESAKRNSARVLEMVRQRGVVPGRALEGALDLDRAGLQEAVIPLIKEGLIEAEGDVYNAETIRDTFFGYRPSLAPKIDAWLRENL